jgi:hypothetical protein
MPSGEYEQNMTEGYPNHSSSPTISPRQMSFQEGQPMIYKSNPLMNSIRGNRVSYDSGIGMRGASGRRTYGIGKRRKEEKDVSLSGRWSVSPDTLRVLTPALTSNSRGDRIDDGEDYKSNSNEDKKHGLAGDAKGKKNSGLWTWATWF